MKLGLAAWIAALALAFAVPASASTLIRTVAGTGTFKSTPDGTLATAADVNPSVVAALRAGTTPKDDFVFYDAVTCAVRRVSARTGTIATVAGGDCGFDPSGPYTSANPLLIGIGTVHAIAATDTNGGFLFSHDGWVEQWDPASATVSTIAGIPACHGGATPANIGIIAIGSCQPILGLSGNPGDPTKYLVAAGDSVYEGTVGNSSMALAAGCGGSANTLLCPNLQTPLFRAVTYLSSSTFVVSDQQSQELWKVFRTGLTSPILVAGGGNDLNGEGGLATAADLERMLSLAPGYDGSLYFTQETVLTGGADCRILRVSNTDGTGVLSRVAGGPEIPGADPISCAPNGGAGDTIDQATNLPISAFSISMSPRGLLVVDLFSSRVRLIERTSIISGPPKIDTGWTNLNQATYKIEALDLNPIIKCIYMGSFGPKTCSSTQIVPATSDGYQFLEAGEGHAPATDFGSTVWAWKNDLNPPNSFELSQPADGADHQPARPTFTFAAATDPPIVYSIDGTDNASGVAGYELWIDGQKSAAGGCCSLQPASNVTEGKHTWSVKAVDGAGNVRESAQRSFTAGGNAPVASFSIAPNPALVGRSVTFTNTSTDPDGGSGAKWEWDLDGDGSFESQGETVAHTYDQPGTVTIGLRVTDATGLSATATQDVKVNAATISGQFGVTINNGAQYTRTPNVTVSANFPASVSQLLVSNDGGFLAPTSFQPQKSFAWKLDSSGPERLPKIVYVRFLSGPITSETYTDDIILDETPPKVDQASLLPAPGPASAAAAAAKKWRLKIRASDSNSGVAGVQATANKKKPGRLLSYATRLTVSSAARPRFIRARDRAGNLSGWKKIR